MKATEVHALSNHRIQVVFDDGVSGIIELKDLIQSGIFQKLKEERVFQNVYIDGDAIAWSEELEIDANNIYAEILQVEPSTLIHKPSYNAAD